MTIIELAAHGERTWHGIKTTVDGHADVALQWLRRQRKKKEDT
ncbi:hypothetical protein [Saccharopolyspora phatthalungensis]|uniref:Uncharacterized protein n=1 Tax=Saccharopolyspora phatthalungensis TaxID=664693 RepID=A0A840QJP9_9PSEU|nr:hypothetical protein [Saccharopolyspora phatthalungensis]MBB5158193.1 hypothetical protein [Saccharopolyspora phatthalungensis]